MGSKKITPFSVGIVGYGAFGALLHTLFVRFAPEVQVRIFSSRKVPDGETFFALEEVAQCDAVILAVPIRAFEETLVRIIPLTRSDTMIVDVATVKEHTENLLKKYAPGRFIATHPMWGPESYKKKGESVEGFRIVVTAHTLSAQVYESLRARLQSLGFVVVEMSAQKHDTHLAETLFLTHFVGQVITDAGFDRTAIDTVSFRYLMDAVESVRHDAELFRDVYHFVPACKEVLQRFAHSEQRIQQILTG